MRLTMNLEIKKLGDFITTFYRLIEIHKNGNMLSSDDIFKVLCDAHLKRFSKIWQS